MKKILSYIISSALFMSFISVSKAENAEIDIKRISGSNRYSTASEISKEYFEKSNTVVLASGEGYADALVGGSLVSQEKIPMFLTKKNTLNKETKDELLRLETKKVYILGGVNTISQKVENEIKKMGIAVNRLAGKDRLETAGKIAVERYNLASKKNPNIVIGDLYAGIDGYSYADALVAGSIIGQMENQVYILPYIKNNPSSRDLAYEYVFGGFNSIPKNVEVAVRIAGNNRYETSVEAAKKFEMLTKKKLKTVILVDGGNYPDALAASTLAGKENATVITSPKNKLNKEAKKFIRNNGIEKVIIIGGENSVSKNVEQEINDSEDLSASTHGGWKQKDGKKYYYEAGKMVTGWKNIDGDRYFFDEDGSMHTGWYFGSYKDKEGYQHQARYYFNKDGSLAKEGSLIEGWITQADGVSILEEDAEKEKINLYLTQKRPDIEAKLKSGQYKLYKDVKKLKGKDQFNITDKKDYWSTNIQGVILFH